MSIEEKAKAYDEALKKAKKYHEEYWQVDAKDVTETLFPELRESEDETTRKELLDFMRSFWADHKETLPQAGRWVTYLEKQKEHNRKDEEYTDFTIYHPLKNGKGKYECIPYSFYGSLTSFSEDKDLIDFLRTCFYTKEECNEWIEQQKEQNEITIEQVYKEFINPEKLKDAKINKYIRAQLLWELMHNGIITEVDYQYLIDDKRKPWTAEEYRVAYQKGFEMSEQLKQKEQKEINLVNILKHYPKETELYSPLYGKLWLAEVDDTNGIITCYKHPLEKNDVRATLKQEDTVSFYSNGTTGLPDFNVSEDCMLFLYDTKKQKEQKPIEDVIKNITKDKESAIKFLKSAGIMDDNGELAEMYRSEQKLTENNIITPQFHIGDYIKPKAYNEEHLIKDINKDGYVLDIGFVVPFKHEDVWEVVKPKQEWSEEDEKMVRFYENDYDNNLSNMPMRDVIENRIKFKDWLLNRLKSLRPQPKPAWSENDENNLNTLIQWDGIPLGLRSWVFELPEKVGTRPSWKPSEEQMKALRNVAYENGNSSLSPYSISNKDLASLYEELKKLM